MKKLYSILIISLLALTAHAQDFSFPGRSQQEVS